MEIYAESRMESVFYDSLEAEENFPCIVKLDQNNILVEYIADEEIVMYTGHSIGDGHYELTCPAVNGKATLHGFNRSKILEGSWVESQERGMWRIHLIK